MNISLPYNFDPRNYQQKFWQEMQTKKRASLVWHRRTGKDLTVFNYMVTRAVQEVGNYYYFFPTFKQGRRVLWEGKTRRPESRPFLDYVPKEVVFNRKEIEMQIVLKHPGDPTGKTPGSIIQVIGTDDYDSIRGSNPIGCVFSEYAEQDPGAWNVVRPILEENGGWAVFIFTPKGLNHAYRLHEAAKRFPDRWFAQTLTIDDTGVFTHAQVEQEIAEGMDPDFAQQEYYCSFHGSIVGSFYGAMVARIEGEGHMRPVPYLGNRLVHTAWDIGVDDEMVIWFFQLPNGFDGPVHLVDYVSGRRQGLPYYAKILREKNYVYGTHLFPHDMKVQEAGTGFTRLETAESLGIRPAYVVERTKDVGDAINAVRVSLPRMYFDPKCDDGVNALRHYKKELDEDLNTFKNKPLHDWASHPADALRTLVQGLQFVDDEEAAPREQFAQSDFSGYESAASGADFNPYRS